MLFKCFDNPVLLQATANVIVFVCVNVVGVFMHNLMEHAQRKAFLDTRNCIAARLEMEDENEKLVRFLNPINKCRSESSRNRKVRSRVEALFWGCAYVELNRWAAGPVN
jgi:hypothetical protein